MKRIKIAQNRFVRLWRTETDTGHTIGFELTKPPLHHPPLLASFRPDQWKNAARAFLIVSDALRLTGLPRDKRRVTGWLNRSSDFSARIEPKSLRARRKRLKTKNEKS